MNLSKQTKELLFLLLAILIGALAAVSTLGFLALIEVGQWAFWPGSGRHFATQVLASPWWLRMLIPTLGGLAVGPVIAYLAQEARGPGVPEVIEAAALREGHILPTKAGLKAWVTGLTIATGGSVGREGPVVGIGAAIGSYMTRLFSFSTGKGRICLACGTAAAFAATFNTPITGALFTIEIILADLEIIYLGHIVISAIVAVLISRQFLGDFPMFRVSTFVFHHNIELLIYLALGVLAGLLAIAFTRTVYATDSLFRRIPLPEWLKPALGGLGLGALAVASPYILGVGYDSINLSLAGKFALVTAAFLIATKFLATVLCLGSGMSGGIMGPSLFMGAMLGTVLSMVANQVFPGLHLVSTDFALVGMGAMVSGTTLGPITATLLIFEMSNSHAVIVPAMVSCIASFIAVKSLYGYSTYDMKLLRRGVRIFQGRAVHLLESMKVKDYISKKMELIHDDTPLPEILHRAEESPYPFFVVLDEKEELSGVLTLWDLRPVLAHQPEAAETLTARDLKTSEVVTVHPEDDFETAIHLLENKNFSSLPVVLPPRNKVVVGILKIEAALTAYNQRLLKEQTLRYPMPGSAKPE
ncbi:MAG: chloride channel protein [Deltaproteobacteria bacterium]|jgi:chloride channel protein, CIC family